jgi:hypothetical protein
MECIATDEPRYTNYFQMQLITDSCMNAKTGYVISESVITDGQNPVMKAEKTRGSRLVDVCSAGSEKSTESKILQDNLEMNQLYYLLNHLRLSHACC